MNPKPWWRWQSHGNGLEAARPCGWMSSSLQRCKPCNFKKNNNKNNSENNAESKCDFGVLNDRCGMHHAHALHEYSHFKPTAISTHTTTQLSVMLRTITEHMSGSCTSDDERPAKKIRRGDHAGLCKAKEQIGRDKLPHGEYGDWREKNIIKIFIKVRRL